MANAKSKAGAFNLGTGFGISLEQLNEIFKNVEQSDVFSGPFSMKNEMSGEIMKAIIDSAISDSFGKPGSTESFVIASKISGLECQINNLELFISKLNAAVGDAREKNAQMAEDFGKREEYLCNQMDDAAKINSGLIKRIKIHEENLKAQAKNHEKEKGELKDLRAKTIDIQNLLEADLPKKLTLKHFMGVQKQIREIIARQPVTAEETRAAEEKA